MADRRNSGGRPSKFTTDIAVLAGIMLARRQSIADTAKAAEVGVSTLQRWLHRGRQGDPRFALLAEAADASIAFRFKFSSFAKVKRYLRDELGKPRRFRA